MVVWNALITISFLESVPSNFLKLLYIVFLVHLVIVSFVDVIGLPMLTFSGKLRGTKAPSVLWSYGKN